MRQHSSSSFACRAVLGVRFKLREGSWLLDALHCQACTAALSQPPHSPRPAPKLQKRSHQSLLPNLHEAVAPRSLPHKLTSELLNEEGSSPAAAAALQPCRCPVPPAPPAASNNSSLLWLPRQCRPLSMGPRLTCACLSRSACCCHLNKAERQPSPGIQQQTKPTGSSQTGGTWSKQTPGI